ncbi:MAG: class I SAM-dependent methyltransferase [Candidatus Binatia bacterium]
MAVHFTSRELSKKYDRFARWYDWVEVVPEALGGRKLRCEMLQRVSGKGKVLEIAVGTGKNLHQYPPDSSIVAMDISREMLTVAQRRALKLSMNVKFLLADAEAIPFPDKSFDTVISSFTICTFPNPVAALREMLRVCRAEGCILLLEHGRSNREWLGRLQDRHEDSFAKRLGCHWNREPLQIAREAGLILRPAQRSFLGVFHVIEATVR